MDVIDTLILQNSCKNVAKIGNMFSLLQITGYNINNITENWLKLVGIGWNWLNLVRIY